MNFVDTANRYSMGESEEIVGKAIAGRRDEVVLATKVFMPGPGALLDRGNSRRHVMLQVEESLPRLRTDWIDLYQIHRNDADTPIVSEHTPGREADGGRREMKISATDPGTSDTEDELAECGRGVADLGHHQRVACILDDGSSHSTLLRSPSQVA